MQLSEAISEVASDALSPAGLYRLMAWLSPGFPVGGYSYSHGLEAAVEAVLVRDRPTLEDYVGTALSLGGPRVDAILFVAAWRAVSAGDAAAFAWAAERAAVMRGSAELALESAAQGQAFLAALAAGWPNPQRDRWTAWFIENGRAPAYAVTVALAAAVEKIALRPALLAYLQAVAANLVSAGVRLIPLGQSDGQRALAALEQPIGAAHAAALAASRDDLGSAAPFIDVLSMRHETQHTRLFRS